jgi:hypothetical protein
VIEAKDVLFNLGRGSRRNVEMVLYLDLGRRQELSRSLLNLAERDGRASYPQFTARRRVPT